MHETIRGILLAETSGLTSSEFASVVATSGTTSAESESLGNNWNLSHLVDAFSTQWGVAARDAKAMKTEAVWAAIDFLTCLDSQEPRLAVNMQFPGMMFVNQSMITEMVTKNTMKTMLSGTQASTMTEWRGHHERGPPDK